MTDINKLFFELIRVATDNQVCLSHKPRADEWGELYVMAKKQSLVGVCFAGVQKLQMQRQCPSEMLYLQWMGMAAKIQQRNEVQNMQCAELQAKLTACGMRSSILKGQGVACLYDYKLRNLRQSGDIDVYVDCGRERAIEYARSIQDEVDWDYKHLHLKVFMETEVEMHYRPEVFLNLFKNKKLQRWFERPEIQKQMFCKQGEFVTPSAEFNLFFILLHTYRHFLYEGVGLRQLMDYYFVLLSSQESERVSSLRVIERFGMSRFTAGVMWIMQMVFGLNKAYLLCEPNEKEGRYILDHVMQGGNFGRHDKNLKIGVRDSQGRISKYTTLVNIIKHNCHMLWHYPTDASWGPIWLIWHKCWKVTRKTI